MKTNLILGGLALLALLQTATATLVVSQDWTVNQVLADNNPAGYAASQTFSGLDASAINQVDVRLNISGGYNGDLYGYLVLQSADSSTTTAILLNRVGRTGAADFGYGTAGMNVTLSGDLTQGYANIHDVANPGGGPYLADGRTVSPLGDFSGAGSTAGLEVLNGHNANGTWTLFLADMAGGDMSTLVSWGLDISVVPEPATWALLVFGSLIGIYAVGRRNRRPQVA